MIYKQKIPLIPYHENLMLLIADNDGVLEVIKSTGIDIDLNTFGVVYTKNRIIHCLLNAEAIRDYNMIYESCIAHESVHVVDALFACKGVKVNIEESNEHYAYMIGYVVLEVIRVYRKMLQNV